MAGEIAFRGRVRRWKEEQPGGFAVVDVPADLVAQLGGRRQYRVEGTLNGSPFTGSTMLVAGGGFAVGLSKVALSKAGIGVGDDAQMVIGRPVDSAAGRSS
jgi:hypothetical protein